MKKHLLAISMVMTGFGLFSQSTVWNPHNSNLDTTSGVRWMSVVDKDTVWAIKSDGTYPSAASNKFSRTINGGTFVPGTFLPDTLYYNSSSIKALNSKVAYIPCYSKDATRNGVIMKTTDGGLTWNNVVDTIGTSMFVGANNFPDWCHFWDVNHGIAMGDPNGSVAGGTAPAEMEIWKTNNGGTTWTRVPDANIPNPVGSEYGLTDSYFAMGKFLWFGTAHSASAVNHVYRSNDTGNTWLSSTVPGMNGGVSGLAFRDSLNGICWGSATSGGKFIAKRTTDGGATWTTIFQGNNMGIYDMCVVPGRNAYMSVGLDSASVAAGGVVGNGIVTSVTYDDGDTWVPLETAPGGAGANAFVMLKVCMLDSAHGWAGSFSDTTNKPFGGGGMNNWMGPVIAKACPLNISGVTNICNGNTTVLTANAGAATYTWMPGPVNTNTISVSPNTTQIYTVNSNAAGCLNSKTYTLNVTATPTVSITSSVTNDTIYNVNCASSPTVTTLGAVGAATSYSWAPTAGITGTGASVAAHPTVTTTYTLTGHTGACIGTSTVTVVSINCVNINQLTVNGTAFSVYPNPSNGQITVSLTNVKAGTVLAISDLLGNEVYRNTLNTYNMSQTLNLDLSALPKGVYLFGISNGNQSKVQKLVIQ
ncbi:MAG: T9SS type A sorting domain-containing protein, partial [Bacteroidia bacterium]